MIEVKSSIGSVKTSQFSKYLDSNNMQYINMSEKKIILYIDEPMVELSSANIQKIHELEENGVEIVNSLEELKGVIE